MASLSASQIVSYLTELYNIWNSIEEKERDELKHNFDTIIKIVSKYVKIENTKQQQTSNVTNCSLLQTLSLGYYK